MGLGKHECQLLLQARRCNFCSNPLRAMAILLRSGPMEGTTLSRNIMGSGSSQATARFPLFCSTPRAQHSQLNLLLALCRSECLNVRGAVASAAHDCGLACCDWYARPQGLDSKYIEAAAESLRHAMSRLEPWSLNPTIEQGSGRSSTSAEGGGPAKAQVHTP